MKNIKQKKTKNSEIAFYAVLAVISIITFFIVIYNIFVTILIRNKSRRNKFYIWLPRFL